jgi:hypothetical protein
MRRGVVCRPPRGLAAFASVYLMLFPAYCLMHSLCRSERSDFDQHTVLSFAFAFGLLRLGGFLLCSKLPKRRQAQRMRLGAGGEAKGQCRTLFDGLEELVILPPLPAHEVFPSLTTRLAAFPSRRIGQEHLHSAIPGAARNQRVCAVTHGLAEYPELKPNDTKCLGGCGHIRIHKGVCRGRIECEQPSLTGAYQDMEKIDDMSPRHAA